MKSVVLAWAVGLCIGLCPPSSSSIETSSQMCPSGDPCDESWSYTRNGSRVTFYGLRNLSDAVMGEGVEQLVVNASCLPTLDLSQLIGLPSLRDVTVTHSAVTVVVGGFPPNNSITRLDLSCNNISDLDPLLFTSAPSLRELDVSRNQLGYLPDQVTSLTTLAIADNPLNCAAVAGHLYDWYEKGNGSAALGDQDTLVICKSLKKDDWLKVNYTLRDAFRGEQEKERACGLYARYNCTCKLERYLLLSGAKGVVRPVFDVDCSGRGLTDLPPMSASIRSLNVSGNKIRNLDLLRNESYKSLEKLYADDNMIESLNILEVSTAKLVDLSLKRNQIKSIPTYILDGVLKRGIVARIYLGNNYIYCNCKTVRHIKEKLLGYQNFYSDVDDIMCESPRKRVIDLTVDEVCQVEKEALWTTLLFCLVAVEAVLVFGLLARLVYDAHRFHRTGYLPWLSAKMPPLPCDCMLETMSPSDKSGPSRSWSDTTDNQWEESSRGTRRAAERVPLNKAHEGPL